MSFKSVTMTIAHLLIVSMESGWQTKTYGLYVMYYQMRTEEYSLETKLMW